MLCEKWLFKDLITYYLLTERGHYSEISDQDLDGIDTAIALSIHQGRGLRSPCNDRTRLISYLLCGFFSAILKNITVIFHIRLRAQQVI